MFTKHVFTGVLSVLCALFLFTTSSRAETTRCVAITFLPYTISAPGTYCVNGNLSTNITSGYAIYIVADNVVLDLNGNTIDGSGAGTSTNAWGIYSYNRKNNTVKNGTISGFLSGVGVSGSDSIIEDLRIDRCTNHGIFSSSVNSIIRNNLITNTGGAIYSDKSGITLYGNNSQVKNNVITNTSESSGQSGYGIAVIANNCVINDNHIVNNAFGPGTSYGIGSYGSYSFLKNNQITYFDYGIYSYSTNKYRDNMASNVTYPYTGGINAGNNN